MTETKHGQLGFLAEGRIGDHHEAVAIHSRNFHRHALRRTTRKGAKLSVVRLLRSRDGRCYELRVRNLSAMRGYRARDWWVLRTQSAVPVRAGTISAPQALSLLRLLLPQKPRQLGNINRNPPRLVALTLKTIELIK